MKHQIQFTNCKRLDMVVFPSHTDIDNVYIEVEKTEFKVIMT